MTFFLSGCYFRIHKFDIQQGNVFTEEDVSHLHTGMSESQVKEVMGTPVMANILANDRIEYIYTNQPGHQVMTVKRLTLIFQNGRLREIIRH